MSAYFTGRLHSPCTCPWTLTLGGWGESDNDDEKDECLFPRHRYRCFYLSCVLFVCRCLLFVCVCLLCGLQAEWSFRAAWKLGCGVTASFQRFNLEERAVWSEDEQWLWDLRPSNWNLWVEIMRTDRRITARGFREAEGHLIDTGVYIYIYI